MKQNPFKVGDRVAVYHGYNRCVGTIERVSGDMVSIVHYGNPFHWRQCSKITKKPRKTIWVNENERVCDWTIHDTEEEAKSKAYNCGWTIHDTEEEAKSKAYNSALRVAVLYREVKVKK